MVIAPFIYAFIAGMVSLVFMYMDAKLFNEERTKGTYVKNVLLVMMIVWFVVFLLDVDSVKSTMSMVGNSVRVIPELGERMLTGAPDF